MKKIVLCPNPNRDEGLKATLRVRDLLEREGFSTASVELCLATGGMVNMPMVKNRLDAAGEDWRHLGRVQPGSRSVRYV